MSLPPLAAPQVQLQYSAQLNAAMQQNHVPPVRAIQLTAGPQGLPACTLSLSTNLGLWQPCRVEVPALDPGVLWDYHKFVILPEWEALAGLTERQEGTLQLVLQAVADGTVLYENSYPLSLLPFDHWQGIQVLPELLAAYVTPNLPVVQALLREAAVLLQKWTGRADLDDYQSKDPNRIRQQMAAIYEAIVQRQIIYVTVPPSFEEQGQRIRMPQQVVEQAMGNCLDMSVLYAACLEAAGLHPLLITIKGHAFAGCWLVQDTFADAVCYDESLLTKRAAEGIHEIALVEATCMNAGKGTPFETAEKKASQHLMKAEDFHLFVDVKRARYAGVRPLPMRVSTAEGWQWAPTAMATAQAAESRAPGSIAIGPQLEYSSQKNIPPRQQLWERKLLDLSLRNSLLNMRISKQHLQLITDRMAQLEDILAANQELLLLPRPKDWDGQLRQAGLYESLHAGDPIHELVHHELDSKRLRSYLPEEGFYETLLTIYRKTKVAMEENGANTLFLTLGTLRWYETESSQMPRYAPLMLMPVELVRRGAHRGFVIRSRDEETQINITLLEMLRQDFGLEIQGLEQLPRDANGIDVKQVIHLVRQLIMHQPRWDVEDLAFIGHFSFSKFVMWRDLHDNAHLLARNTVVDSLLAQQLRWKPAEDTTHTSLDARWRVQDLLLPISADSSQLKAIGAALAGESFVLHGPPGTGKSQTITNLIANALYQGKRVLFVAEKMAALEVVEKRLESIGLGTYCLELHSNKARKGEVLQQLKSILEAARPVAQPAFEAEAERLQQLRTELNAYVEALHQPGLFGRSLHQNISAYYSHPHHVATAPMPDTLPQLAATTTLPALQDAAGNLQAAAQVCGTIAGHPLQRIGSAHYSATEATLLQEALHGAAAALEALQGLQKELLPSLGLPEGYAPTRSQDWLLLQQWASLWLTVPPFATTLWQAPDPLSSWEQAATVAGVGLERDRLQRELLAQGPESSLTAPANAWKSQWQEAEGKWWLPRWWGMRQVRSALQKAGVAPMDAAAIPAYLDKLIHYQRLAAKVQQEGQWLAPLMESRWQGGLPDWGALIAACQVLQRTWQAAATLLAKPAAMQAWQQSIDAHLQAGVATYTQAYSPLWTQVSTQWKAFEQHWHTLEEHWQLLPEASTQAPWLPHTLHQIDLWLQHQEQWRDWAQYRHAAQQLEAAGLGTVVQALQAGQLPQEHLAASVSKGLAYKLAHHTLDSSPALQQFSAGLYGEKIHRFEALLQHFEALSRQQIAASVAARIPNMLAEAAKSSEIGILQRAIANGGRGISIRQLFAQLPHLLPRMVPCMLMSPISVAQYLSLELPPFDMVVFDEASQMPTSEAIGALARGKQVIVVGDPKQMPPTSFFSSQQSDDEPQAHEDLESILDDCLALPMPSRYLLWHYRSRHESLIAFSNAHYYDNALLTFPSADDIATKVQWVPVAGHYDRSKGRHNRAEAEAVVAEVLQRLRLPAGQRRSLGIVTFSSVQQKLIQDLMDAAWEQHPDLETQALQHEEPLFIKNLENVQGDERDVILFSIGYGPDKEGKVYLNFGPINREGGWRRLNVAVSRARYEMKVFSTLRAAHIDLSRTASEGVAGLRGFLEYAEKGRQALAMPGAVQPVGITGPFERHVALALEQKGYTVHKAVGSSGFRIDLAIVHPEQPGRYALGLLCDGPRLAAMGAARDRFVGKMQVLRGLGWPLHRVWSTAWWMHPERTLGQIEEALQAALQEDQSHLPSLPEVEPVAAPEAAPEAAPGTYLQAAAPAAEVLNWYQPALLPPVKDLQAADFLQPRCAPTITRQLQKVVEAEAPITRKLLYQRVLQAWGISRSGSRLQAHLDALTAAAGITAITIQAQELLLPPGMDVQAWTGWRAPHPHQPESRREAEHLPIPEVALAMQHLLRQQFSMETADLLREAARLLGFARMGAQVEAALQDGLAYGQAQGWLHQSHGKWMDGKG